MTSFLTCTYFSNLMTARFLRVCLLCVMPVGAAALPAQEIDFDSQVATLFSSHCIKCHSGAEPRGGLELTNVDSATTGGESGPAYKAGSPEDSLIWDRVVSDEMPPKHPLKPAEKQILKQWVQQGARWGTSPIDPFAVTTADRAGRDWWSLQPLRASSWPEMESSAQIDQHVQQKLTAAGLQSAPPAAPRTLIRRLYFDLTGLPPSPEAVQNFVNDPSPKAYENMVDRLLGSRHYGERWGRHWLDVVRFGESDGFERNTPRKNAWHYRDWVVEALNKDLPYDQFVRMQLIGDLTVGGTEGAAATGFWVAGVHNTVVGGSRRMKLLARQDELEEVLATVGQTFVGLTVNCARCHDHKFDPITQKEFYRLASAISGLGYGEREEHSTDDSMKLADMDRKLNVLRDKLNVIDKTARQEIIAARKKGIVTAPEPPAPYAKWEFDDDLKDSIGNLHGRIVGNARLENGALVVDGKSFVETTPLQKDIQEKTLETWVQLDNLNQRGGASISIETRNGVTFDAIVFGEREPKQWMAGSNGFARTDSFQAPQEADAVRQPVHIALVYSADGTITGYRNGVAYGRPIRKSGPQPYKAGDTEFVFGLRHKPNGNKNLSGRIFKAAFYDRALTPEEVAASSGNSADYVPEKQIVEWLKGDLGTQRAGLKSTVTTLTEARNKQAAKATRKIYTLTPRGGAKATVLLRGDPDNVGDVVSPGGVASVQGVNAEFGLTPEAPEADRRRQLAEWVTSRDNPLFARVIVNRIWHYHFGTGLVDTPNDLGFNGGRPSHPELLDSLAAWLRDQNYSLKKLHRLILLSSTWKQAGYVTTKGRDRNPQEIDADNRLLWRMTPRRLEAESVRDAMLVVAGQLNADMGGPSFEDVSIIGNNGTTYYEPKEVVGAAFYRRTIYRFNPRGGRSALLDTFDCPDPAATAPRRAVTTTPLQALSLLNNSFVLQMSEAFAERIRQDIKDGRTNQISRAWQLVIAREPSQDERQLSEQLIKDHGLEALCRGLLNISEFIVIE